MSDSVVASRYAVALFELGQEKSLLDQLLTEVQTVQSVFKENKELNILLQHPSISAEKKKTLLKDAFKDVTKELLNTLFIMVESHRETEITSMTKAFISMTNESRGVAEADVYSVRALSDDEKQSLEKVFAEKLGKNSLHITNIIDPSLIGGVKLKIGNRIYDGSVSRKLERIERELVSANK
ncbi:F-type H+-transporting ATPase subunit delta [Salinibacillus kushneri]|uniref:ATP synthase subunit delta n=1 Tax=Salinibacillus kushneri TaxID=237682 RepID=A0A1I0CWZ6_9BACI|nr:F0F1 ATP synthase subunit delta [Salinibacillus kushneri]SET24284.1 F-type H+-transporting ATPase subunit delta [Salinibacillus kushneri]